MKEAMSPSVYNLVTFLYSMRAFKKKFLMCLCEKFLSNIDISLRTPVSVGLNYIFPTFITPHALFSLLGFPFFFPTVKPGVRYRELGNIIQKHAQANGFSVVRSYCGHGIHRLFHTAPNVPHYASEYPRTCQERYSSICKALCVTG